MKIDGRILNGWNVASFALQFESRVDKLVLSNAAGIDERATEVPFDLNISTLANMHATSEAMCRRAPAVPPVR